MTIDHGRLTIVDKLFAMVNWFIFISVNLF